MLILYLKIFFILKHFKVNSFTCLMFQMDKLLKRLEEILKEHDMAMTHLFIEDVLLPEVNSDHKVLLDVLSLINNLF